MGAWSFYLCHLPCLTAEENKPPTLRTIRRASCFHVDLLLQPFRSDTVHLTTSHTPAQEHATSRNRNSWKAPSPRPRCGLTTHLARAREPEALIAPTLALHCSKLTGMAPSLERPHPPFQHRQPLPQKWLASGDPLPQRARVWRLQHASRGCRGECKSWTLDWTMDWDYGLEYGLNSRLIFKLLAMVASHDLHYS